MININRLQHLGKGRLNLFPNDERLVKRKHLFQLNPNHFNPDAEFSKY